MWLFSRFDAILAISFIPDLPLLKREQGRTLSIWTARRMKPKIPVLNHHDTTTVEIGLVTSSPCQTKTHGVHERNLSTRVFVGILGPLWSNRQYRIVSIDRLKSPRVVFTNSEKVYVILEQTHEKNCGYLFLITFLWTCSNFKANVCTTTKRVFKICKHDTGRFYLVD